MDVGVFASGAAVAVLSVILGYTLRVREVVRGDRRAAYLRYIHFIDKLPLRITEVVTDADYTRIGDEMGALMVEVEGELSLVASNRVLNSAVELRRAITDDRFGEIHAQLLGGGRTGRDLRAEEKYLVAFWKGMAPARLELLNSMRADLRVKQLSTDPLADFRAEEEEPPPAS